jgi:Tfp pilus assembly protein PilF
LGRDEPFKIVHHLERAIEADPGYPESYVELGRYYGYMGEPALAKATFERWTVRHPEDADMLINAGLTLFDASDFAEAYAFFEKAVEVATEEEQRSGALTFRANALDMLGRYDEAVAAYEEVISRRPSGGRPTPTLGICHARNGRMERAEAAFRRGSRTAPARRR